MKKTEPSRPDELRAEYDFAKMKGGVRGKYVSSYREGTNLVRLDPDVAQAFPSDAAVNETLRAVMTLTRALPQPKRRRKA